MDLIFKVRSDDANAFDHESYCNISSLFAWRTVESSGGHFMDVLFYVKGALTCGKRLMVLNCMASALQDEVLQMAGGGLTPLEQVASVESRRGLHLEMAV